MENNLGNPEISAGNLGNIKLLPAKRYINDINELIVKIIKNTLKLFKELR